MGLRIELCAWTRPHLQALFSSAVGVDCPRVSGLLIMPTGTGP